MSKTTQLMTKQISEILDVLRSYEIPVFEDNIPSNEDEKFKNDNIKGYHLFVYETGEMQKHDDMKSLIQDVVIYYYSEKRDDLDERAIDIILKMNQKNIKMLSLQSVEKQQFKVKDKDRFVDRITFIYSRKIVLEGCVAL